MRIPFVEPYRETVEEETVFVCEKTSERDDIVIIDDKAKTKYIKYLEKLIRGSYEYKKEYIPYLSDSQGMNICSVFMSIGKKLARSVKIHIHHEPFTLYDICLIVLTKHMEARDKINTMDICEEVMEIHFKGQVGLLPLSCTVHEAVHAGKVFIPLQYLDDGFMKFYNEYKPYIKKLGMEEILMKKLELSKTFNNQTNSILKKKFIKVQSDQYERIPEKLDV